MPIRFRIYLSVAAIVVLGIIGFRRFAGGDSTSLAEPGKPEIAIPLPSFSLTDQDARSFTLEEMRGHVTIVDFFFTKCPSICPRLTRNMAAIATAAKDDAGIRFVSISVDPENDTPRALRAYGVQYGADFARWSFLTGDQKVIEETVLRGFKVAYAKEPGGSIAHAERFVLVDRKAAIRAYFDADDEGQGRILAAARKLAD